MQIVDNQSVFVGNNVTFDTNNPQLITIEEGAWITYGSLILTHFRNPAKGKFDFGPVRICRNAFLGAYTVICKPVRIGENSVVGAGSIVTKDIPDNEVWAGVPARFIKKL